MKSIEDVKQSSRVIRSCLDERINTEDTNGLSDYLEKLSSLDGLSCELLATAKRIQGEEELVVLLELKDLNLPPSKVTQLLKAKTAKEIALVTYCDRLNAAIHHKQDSLRSILSLRKEEMKLVQ